jgi:hypothetical protein
MVCSWRINAAADGSRQQQESAQKLAEAGVRQSNQRETPEVWALAGAMPLSGCSSAALLLAAVAAQDERPVWLFHSGQMARSGVSAAAPAAPICGNELQRLLQRLESTCRESADELYRRLRRVGLREAGTPLWVLDLGCSRSHRHWDLFWSADLAIMVAGAKALQQSKGMIASARQRWVERIFAPEEVSLHAHLATARSGKSSTPHKEYFNSRKLQRLSANRIIYRIIMREQGEQKAEAVSPAAEDPISWQAQETLFDAGNLFRDPASAELLRAARRISQPLPTAVQSELMSRFDELSLVAAADGRNGKIRHSGTETRLGDQRILNLDLNFFDAPAAVSPFGAADDNL